MMKVITGVLDYSFIVIFNVYAGGILTIVVLLSQLNFTL